ncbi:GATA zinc finger domain-containing protein [Hirsutella rhossiliensis]|uniref:GATA zinc finger domain-containing protein n=1 Tax=Hirsutella rhossiliensis TaxID=111463 RepID=A0A9P8SI93_9HYPO|nr:GATA zinc finger domain-containing protein [Hirsutella rhossiliensis]KAH0962375.1 GATA zinc finger domain-containing protein [Hirsutella rhossiliensis]
MSYRQPPPQGSFFGFSDLDMAGQDSGDVMALFNNTLLNSFDDLPMTNDSALVSNSAITDESIAHAENQFNTAANNVPGAGPVPPGALAQMSLSNGSTLTEFTKRRNWPAKVVEELKDFLHILDANGRIKYASPSVLSVAGYTGEEILDVFLKDLIHTDDRGVFVSELNESIASGNPLRMFYRFKKKDGSYAMFEAVGHAHIAAAKFAPNPNNQSPFCQAVFMMARPYPTRNAGLLDSFLEHKMENERLRRRIAELRREEEADADEAQRQWMQSQEGRSDVTPSEITVTSSSTPLFRGVGASQPDRSAVDIALTRENLEGAVAGSRPDSLRDKMARYEGASHADTIEMLTGLRYQEGERSRGITTGNASPTLIRGDAGIAIPMDRDSRPGEKKKKLKTTEEYVCTDCGTLDSPEWRKGPSGPKTLCNACGLRWAKKEKKRNSANSGPQQAPMMDRGMG